MMTVKTYMMNAAAGAYASVRACGAALRGSAALACCAAVLALSACSEASESSLPGAAPDAGLSASGDGSVGFSAYVPRTVGGATRAGAGGELTANNLKGLDTDGTTPLADDADLWHQKAGFGVFGYYTDNRYYQNTAAPNFMYNQQVRWTPASGTTPAAWTYEPVKYWPNEFTGAEAAQNDHVTFFAYAPYVDVDRASGRLLTDPAQYEAGSGSYAEGHDKLQNFDVATAGITALSRRDDTGDPLVYYNVSTDAATNVDLCWGVVPASLTGKTADTDGRLPWGPEGSEMKLTPGLPWLDLTRAKTVDDKVQLQLNHATAKLTATVDVVVDNADANLLEADADNPGLTRTRVYLRSVTLSGLSMQGALNLNNTTASVPRWVGYSGTGRLDRTAVTFHDGRMDGREALQPDAGEQPQGLNPEVVESAVWSTTIADGNTTGVTTSPQNLFATGTASDGSFMPLFVIPNDDRMMLTVVYDVETAVDDLPGYLSDGQTHGTRINNRITAQTPVFASLQAGRAYLLHIHLGLTSVKFDATVTEWEDVKTYSEEFTFTGTKSNDSYNRVTYSDGSSEEWTAPYDGEYLLEVWGAQGGNRASGADGNGGMTGALGGYASTVVTLTQGEKLYVTCGGRGSSTGSNHANNRAGGAGGYNGGGQGGWSNTVWSGGGGGGGATHIARVAGLITNDAVRSQLLVVAGGGGGAGRTHNRHGHGGLMAGQAGGTGSNYNASGYGYWWTAPRTNTWYAATNGNNGQGAAGRTEAVTTYGTSQHYSGSCSDEGTGGGGGGFWGGNANTDWTGANQSDGGCGGSSWAQGYPSQDDYAAGTARWTANGGGANTGHGRARISLYNVFLPR